MTEVAEMREWFAKVLDTVNDLSAQAGLVSGLQQQVNDLSSRLAEVERQNAELRHQVEEANNAVARMASEVEQHRNAASAANEHVNALQSTIVERDSRVTTLTGELATEKDSHRLSVADLDDARRRNSELSTTIDGLRSELTETQNQRSEWHTKAMDFERKFNEAQARLDQIQRMFSPPTFHVVSGDTQATG